MESTLIFLLKTIGLGLLTGFVFGVLFKKVSKMILFFIALIVVLVQVLGFNDILNIDWLSLKNNGQEIVEKSMSVGAARFKLFLTNAPFVLGLIVGFIFGLKR